MAALAEAESAQDAAAALNLFLGPAADYSAEITALIGELYALSSALRRLDKTILELQHVYGAYESIRAEARITLESLNFTFADFNRLLGQLNKYGHLSHSAAYCRVWADIEQYFASQSNCILRRRLEYCRKYVLQLRLVMEQGYPDFEDEYEELGDRIEALHVVQMREADFGIANLSLGQTAAQRQRSFERRRPHIPPPVQPPNQRARMNGTGGRRRPRPLSPQSPGYDPEYAYFPPAPEVPLSPTTTNTTTTHSSSAGSTSSMHWVSRLFDQHRSTTAFRKQGQSSACFEDDMPGVSSRLADEYEKLVEMPFDSGDLLVRLYQRSYDERARIFCRTLRPSRARKDSAIYLTSLEIKRVASTVELYKLGHKHSHLWARLRFSSYERLVLFFCTFLALRADDGHAGNSIPDYRVTNEDVLFQGRISDDSFDHALILYRERDIGAIRLQASVLDGELRRKPVWTAFVTHQIGSRTWITKPSSKVIHLADLQRFIFVDEYTEQLGPNGQHELRFVDREGARRFLKAVDALMGRHHSR